MNNQQTQSYIREVSTQVAMALTSEKTPDAVKDCLKTIIMEASTEADLTVSDFSLIGDALPNVIEKLPVDYGRGFLRSIAAIVRHDTPAFQEFYDRRLDEKPAAANQPVEKDMKDDETEAKKNPLDDRDYAERKRLEMLELAKEIIAQILMVTSGSCTEPEDREYAQKYLFAIFEMFMIRHGNFSPSQFAEDLQSYLFTWTRAHDDASLNWRSNVLSELKFQDLDDGRAAIPKGADEKPTAIASGPTRQPNEPENETESLNDLANQFAAIMQNPLLPTDIYNVLTDEFARVQVSTGTPENILLNLKALSDAEKKQREARNA